MKSNKIVTKISKVDNSHNDPTREKSQKNQTKKNMKTNCQRMWNGWKNANHQKNVANYAFSVDFFFSRSFARETPFCWTYFLKLKNISGIFLLALVFCLCALDFFRCFFHSTNKISIEMLMDSAIAINQKIFYIFKIAFLLLLSDMVKR